jgi:hypothetical protein
LLRLSPGPARSPGPRRASQGPTKIPSALPRSRSGRRILPLGPSGALAPKAWSRHGSVYQGPLPLSRRPPAPSLRPHRTKTPSASAESARVLPLPVNPGPPRRPPATVGSIPIPPGSVKPSAAAPAPHSLLLTDPPCSV